MHGSRKQSLQFGGQHSHKNMGGATLDCLGGVAQADHDEILVKLMSFLMINAVLGVALYMPRVLPLYECPPLDVGSRYLPKQCLDQEAFWPYTRYGPFLVGILTGIFLTTKEEQVLKKKWHAALGWLCCLLIMAAVVGLAYILRETPPHLSVPHALYQGLHRPLWALALTWIIVACEEGYGGFIDSLLSMNVWVPLSNISFACYLIHPVFILIYIGSQETPIHYSDINFMYMFFGHLVLTLVVGYVLTVVIEKPYLNLKWNST